MIPTDVHTTLRQALWQLLEEQQECLDQEFDAENGTDLYQRDYDRLAAALLWLDTQAPASPAPSIQLPVEPHRYRFVELTTGGARKLVDPAGAWVKYDDYAALRASLEAK